MGYIANFLNEKLIAKEAECLIDETMVRLKQRTGILDKLMPLQTYDSDEFLAYITESISPAANLVAAGAEVPMSSYGSFRRAVGELAKFSVGFQWDEVQQKSLAKAMEEASYKNSTVQNMTMSDGSVMKGTNETLVQFLYGSVTKLIQSHVDRLNMLSWQVLQTGEVNYEDKVTRTKMSVDYKRIGATYNHFPTALVATGNVADRTLNRWSDYANADGLTLLFNAIANYIDTNGYKPDGVIMSWRLRNHLMQQTTTKEAARMMAGVAQVGAVGVNMLTGIMEARELVPIMCFDEIYQEVFVTGGTATSEADIKNVRFVSDDTFIFVKNGMGQRAMGKTLEQKLVESSGGKNLGGNSGILVQVKTDPYTPVLDTTTSVSCLSPIILNPKQLYAQRVN